MDKNEAIIRRYVDELNERNLAILDEVVAQSVIFGPDETLSLEEYRQLIVARIERLPGYHVTIDAASSSGDEVSIHWTYRGTDKNTAKKSLVMQPAPTASSTAESWRFGACRGTVPTDTACRGGSRAASHCHSEGSEESDLS